MTHSTVICATFPAYRIIRPYDGRKFRHGEKIAVPYETQRHGTLFNFYTLGTVIGYYVENGDDPLEGLERATRLGHKLYWANANAVTLHNGPHTQETVAGFNIGDTLILQGKRFRIERAPNNNISLIETE